MFLHLRIMFILSFRYVDVTMTDYSVYTKTEPYIIYIFAELHINRKENRHTLLIKIESSFLRRNASSHELRLS